MKPRSMRVTRLMDLPNKTKLRVLTNSGLKDAIFDHPDGMYSYCYLEEDQTQTFHLKLWTPLTLVDGRYEIAD
jgi:hypothetical protein